MPDQIIPAKIQSGESVLRPRARLIKTIGEDLISNDVVAVLELVKNSYDADASIITIKFSGSVFVPEKGDKKQKKKLLKTGAAIEIFDDGFGMSLDTVTQAWMEPATISKKANRVSIGKERKVTGEKGIGRFSAAKLAKSLTMITRYSGDNEVVAGFEWDIFDDPEQFLDQVTVKWEVREPLEFPNDKHGTRLVLSDLNADWDEDKLRRLRVALQRLINPVAPVEGFLIELELPQEFKNLSGLVGAPDSLKKPNYQIQGAVDEQGELVYEYSSKAKGALPLKQVSLVKPDEKIITGPFSFDFRVWDRDSSSEDDKAQTAELRKALNEVSGISIYRDGFRVLPYGDPKLDWLRLDIRRVNNPTMRVSNNQIIGFVSIDLEKNPRFTDQSNREGIVDSDEFEQLKDFITRILAELETKRYEERPRGPGSVSEGGIFDAFSIQPLVDFIKERLPDDAAAIKLVESTQATIAESVGKVQEVLARYRRLSTLGLLVDSVLHDGNNFVGLVDGEIELLVKGVKKDGFDRAKFYEHIDKIRESRKGLAQLFRRLEPFGGRKRSKPSEVQIGAVIENAFGLFEAELKRLNIDVDLPETDSSLVIVEGDLQLIFVNLIQNSMFWLQERKEGRRIKVIIDQRAAVMKITFADNGPGIDPEHHEAIFEPYFSRKPDGIGLGLTIVGELVTENGGTLSLINDGALDGATFEMVFPT